MQISTNLIEQKFHVKLSNYNEHRLTPNYIDADWPAKIQIEIAFLMEEGK